jgi:hypothetical protein
MKFHWDRYIWSNIVEQAVLEQKGVESTVPVGIFCYLQRPTMSEPPLPPLIGNSQQEGGSSLGNIQRVLIDIGQMDVGLSQAAQSTLRTAVRERTTEGPDDPIADQVVVATEAPALQEPPTKKTRNKFTYSQRKFIANSSLYLNPQFKDAFRSKYPDDLDVVGKIEQCPTKKNDNCYSIRWSIAGTDLDQSWLLVVLCKSRDMQGRLRKAIESYDNKLLSTEVQNQPVGTQMPAEVTVPPPARRRQNQQGRVSLQRPCTTFSEHRQQQITAYGSRCAVCRLELGMKKDLGQQGLAKNVVNCCLCCIPAHPYVPKGSNRQIHKMQQFEGLTCFEILHTDEGMAIWARNKGDRMKYSPCMSHPVVMDLREFHGLPRRKAKRKNFGSSSQDGNSWEDDYDADTEQQSQEV